MSENCSLSRPYRVLLVEDNDDDVLLTKHAFKKIPAAIEFQVARDGFEALKLLRREAPFENAVEPQIILLDLNMPRMDGRQLLAEIKQDERLKVVPTIILTTSAAEDDILSAYRNHASAYMTKPIDLEEFARRCEAFVEFWLRGAAVLPN